MKKQGMTTKEKIITTIALAGLIIMAGFAGGIDNDRAEQRAARTTCSTAIINSTTEICR